MLKFFYTAVTELQFWLTILADALLLISVNFVAVYALFMALGSLPPFRGRVRPRAWGLPVLFFISAAAVFSPGGEIVAATLGRIWGGLSVDFWLDSAHKFQVQLHPVAALWAVGCAVCLSLFTLRRRALARGLKNLPEAPPDPAFAAACACLAVQNVGLKNLGEASTLSPFSWGLFRPFIAVPAHFSQTFVYNDRYAIYLHELTHLKNRDSLKYLTIGLAQALLWFNPIARLALSRYKNHLEIVCDCIVVSKHSLSPLDYSRLMLESVSRAAPLAPAFSSAYGDISRRLGYIFRDASIIPVRKDRLIAALAILLFTVTFTLINPTFTGFPPPPHYPPKQVTTPDGKSATMRVAFQWQGALGGYMINSMESH